MKRVLFVDDEPAVLDGLRARMRALRGNWEMVFVESGSRALIEIEHRTFDVIVSDVRMPRMDGLQLLTAVAERWPETVRVVLSGFAEEEKSTRLLGIAHQHLSKPCDSVQLENAINRCFQLHELLHDPPLRALVGRVRQLPVIPRVYAQLVTLMNNDEDVSLHDIAHAIAADPAIAAKVMQVVNSSFFRLAKRITRLDQAVAHLGFAAIRNIALSVELFSQWEHSVGTGDVSPEALQLRAQRLAAVCHSLAAGTSFADDAMLVGLLHSIGYWVLLQACPGETQRALEIAAERGVSPHHVERELLGASHAEIGAYLLGLWGLPYTIVEAVALQYTPHRRAHTCFDVLGAIAVAHRVTEREHPASPTSCDSTAEREYLRSLCAPFEWEEAQRRAYRIMGDSRDD